LFLLPLLQCGKKLPEDLGASPFWLNGKARSLNKLLVFIRHPQLWLQLQFVASATWQKIN